VFFLSGAIHDVEFMEMIVSFPNVEFDLKAARMLALAASYRE